MAVEWVAGAVVAALALAAIGWCIAGDRARGRRRCPKCWHDLSATPGLTCSECGFSARAEADLHRTRRRVGLAVALSIGLFTAALVVRLQVSGESAWSLLPVRVPIALLPHLPARTAPSAEDSSMESLRRMVLGGVREDLLSRIARGDLSIAQVESIADACVAGHDGARPGTRGWLEAYGDVVSMWLSTGESAYASEPFRNAEFDDVSPTREELGMLLALQEARRTLARPVTQKLVALPPIVVLEPVPAASGAPCIMWLDVRGFMAEGGEVRIRMSPTPADALDPIGGESYASATADAAAVAAHGAVTAAPLEAADPEPPLRSHAGRWVRWMPSGSGASRMPVVLGRHPQSHGDDGDGGDAGDNDDGDGGDSASVAVDIAWRASPDAAWRRSSFTQELPRPTASDPRGAEPRDIEPLGVSGAALDAAVASAFEDGVVLWQLGDLPAAIRFNANATSGDDFEGVAIGLVIDLLEDGKVRRRTRIWWPGGDPQASMRAGWEPPEEDIEALRRLARDLEGGGRWSMRLRSDADLARRATSSARPSFWEGEISLPIRARPREEAAPARRFTFVDAPADPTTPSASIDAPSEPIPSNP
jgi:hypothetical protein